MAPIVVVHRPAPTAMPQQRSVSGRPAEWPDAARDAYRGVLAELDSWCRSHNASQELNSWVAEEAIRRSW